MSDAPFLFPFQAMGTACCFHVHAQDEGAARGIAFVGAREVYRLEGKFSRYDPDSRLSAINLIGREGGAVDVDDETAALLDLALDWHGQSGGLFDITSGVLRRIWHADRRDLPGDADLAEVLPLCGLSKLRWTAPTLVFDVPGVELDLGGIVKEYACDRAAALMMDAGADAVLVDLGGDIRVAGTRPDGRGWPVGIRIPEQPDRAACCVEIVAGGLATSGDYARFFEIAGRRYSHVLNPTTGWPIDGCSSVSVLAETCIEAGRLSTIGLLMGLMAAEWLTERGACYLVIDKKGAAEGPLLSRHLTPPAVR